MTNPIRTAPSTLAATPVAALPAVSFDDHVDLAPAPDAELYALVRRAAIDPREVEEPGTRTIEVSVLWQSAILHVAHLSDGQAFAIASEGKLNDPTTLIVDQSVLPTGTTRLTVVADDAGTPLFHFVPGAEGDVESADGARHALDVVRARGEFAMPADALACTMREGERYRTHVGALVVMARLVARPRRVVAAPPRDKRFLGIGVGALALVAGLVGAMQLATASDGAMLSNDDTEGRLADLRDFMAREAARTPPPVVGTREGAAAPEASAGPQGAAGTPHATQQHGSIQIAPHHPQPQSGHRTLGDVGQSGILGLVGPMASAAGASGSNGPWTGITASGTDARDTSGVDGNGDGLGAFGLGHVGTGFGGGGDGEQTVAVGALHTAGTCVPGTPCRGGFGTGNHIGGTGDRGSSGPTIRAAAPTVVGISPDVIRRVVLRNIAQISHCHEQGLAQDPSLAGRVVVTFVIAPGGAVMGSRISQTNVQVASVNDCIASAVRRWTFGVPADQNGPVTVNYPFVLSPAQ